MNENSTAVLIAVYNRSQLLQKTLDSIVDDLDDLTVVIVDDGSRPPVQAETLSCQRPIVLLKHEKNLGLVAALNTGLKYIRDSGCKYLARLDAGDIALEGRFLKQREFLMNNPDYGLVGSRIRSIGSSEAALDDLPSSQLKRRLHVRSEFAHPAVMLTIAAVRETGYYDKGFAGVEDWDYWLRLAKKYEIKNLPEVWTELDGTPGSISRDTKYAVRVQRRWMKVKILWRHFDPGYVESYLGLFRALAVLAVNLVVPPFVILARPGR